MEIQRSQLADVVELRMQGRFDAAWSEFVAAAIDEVVRSGCHRVELHMAAVDYMSSAAIRVLVRHFKQLHAIRGRLSVTSPSVQVAGILQMAGLANLVQETSSAETQPVPPAAVREVREGTLVLELHGAGAGDPVRVTVHGEPGRVLAGGARAADCRALQFPADTWGLGIGAIGSGYADCESRFGEFLAVGGAATTMPADGAQVPDYVVATGELQPGVQALTAVRGVGRFTHHGRFRSEAEGGSIGLSDLLHGVVGQCEAPAVAVALVAEAGCVVGAQLTHSVALLRGSNLFEFPDLRDRMSCTTERGTDRSTVLVCGIVAREPSPALRPHVRPLGMGSELHGHLHALVFPYRPVQQGSLELGATVRQLLEGALPVSLVHLLADDRPYEGIGQTDLYRGALWFAPVDRVEEAGS